MTAADSRVLLSKVRVTDTVIQCCLAHAFTTEKEEIMGVLLGNVVVEDNTPPAAFAADPLRAGAHQQSKVATVWASHIMQRSVLRSDRVEVAAENLISASESAEAMTAETDIHTRVIGWYHSHPRITPFPSTVDLNSQRTYQQLESGWVGLIFSVFYTDSNQRNECSVHCFQASAEGNHIILPLEVVTTRRLGLPLTIGPTPHAMLAMFGQELDAAVETIRERTRSDGPAMAAARGLRATQTFLLERLVAEPEVKYLEWLSIPVLEAELARLQKELKSLQ